MPAGWCYYMLFQCPELFTCVHVCMVAWLRAGKALTSLACLMSVTMSVTVTSGAARKSTHADWGEPRYRVHSRFVRDEGLQHHPSAITLFNVPSDPRGSTSPCLGHASWRAATSARTLFFLDNVQNDTICFGNHVLGAQSTNSVSSRSSGMRRQPICTQLLILGLRLIGCKATTSSHLIRMAILL